MMFLKNHFSPYLMQQGLTMADNYKGCLTLNRTEMSECKYQPGNKNLTMVHDCK